MAPDTGFKATQEILVLVGRAIDGLTPVRKPNGIDAAPSSVAEKTWAATFVR